MPQVGELLQGLVNWAATSDNGWHTKGDKSLWRVLDDLALSEAGGGHVDAQPGGGTSLDPQQQKWQQWQYQVAGGSESGAALGGGSATKIREEAESLSAAGGPGAAAKGS